MEGAPAERRQTTLDLLTGLTPCWLELKRRYERTSGLDAKVGAEYQLVNRNMDDLLGTYFTLTTGGELAYER